MRATFEEAVLILLLIGIDTNSAANRGHVGPVLSGLCSVLFRLHVRCTMLQGGDRPGLLAEIALTGADSMLNPPRFLLPGNGGIPGGRTTSVHQPHFSIGIAPPFWRGNTEET